MPKSWATPPRRNRQKLWEMAHLPRNIAMSGSSVGWVRRNDSFCGSGSILRNLNTISLGIWTFTNRNADFPDVFD